jgi:hypothetical protein
VDAVCHGAAGARKDKDLPVEIHFPFGLSFKSSESHQEAEAYRSARRRMLYLTRSLTRENFHLPLSSKTSQWASFAASTIRLQTETKGEKDPHAMEA